MAGSKYLFRIAVFFVILTLALPSFAIAAQGDVLKEEVESIKAGAAKRIAIVSEKLQLLQIDFVSAVDKEDTQFEIRKLRDRPSSAPPVQYNVYEFFEIDAPEIADDELESANLTFRITARWMDNLKIADSKIMLLRYAGGDWETLEATLIKKTAAIYTYNSKTPGFGYFAIAGERNTQSVEEQAPAPTAMMGITGAAVSKPEADISAAGSAEAQAEPESKPDTDSAGEAVAAATAASAEENAAAGGLEATARAVDTGASEPAAGIGAGLLACLSIIILLLQAATIYLVYMQLTGRKLPKLGASPRKPPALTPSKIELETKRYVAMQREKGRTDAQIRSAFLKVGWNKKQIDEFLK